MTTTTDDNMVMIPIDDFIAYVEDSHFIDMVREMVYSTAYLSYDGKTLRSTTADVLGLFKLREPNRYERELFLKQQEQEEGEK